MDREVGVVSASLGQLAVHYGLLSPAEHSALVDDLRASAQAGAPDSCARRLIRRGIAQRAVLHLLTLGAELGAVLCDGCGEAVPQGELSRREAYPCPRCGCLLFGFRAFLGEPREVGGDSEDTDLLPHVPDPSGTGSPRESRDTDRYDMVLPLPGEGLEPGAGREVFAQTLREQEQATPDMNQTLGFPQVFALPSRETSLTDDDATRLLEAMLEAPAPSAGPDPRSAESRNAVTIMASAAELGIRPPEEPEMETLIASATDLGLRPLAPAPPAERPRIPSRRATRQAPAATPAADEPALWPWLLALGLLCVATAVALGFLIFGGS